MDKKIKILANDGIHDSGKKILLENNFSIYDEKIPQEELINYINKNNIEGLIVRSATQVTEEVIKKTNNLKIIGRAGVGLDNIDLKFAKEKDIHVFNTPHASSQSVAELVFAHIFSTSRMLNQANREMPIHGENNFKKLKKKYSKGIELKNKKLGIIGFGRIGQLVAKIGLGLGMEILAFDKYNNESVVSLDFFNQKKIDFNIKTIELELLLKESDFISVHTPKLDKPILGKQEFEIMKNGVIIINSSRGGVVDEDELLNNISNTKISAAGLDVFINEPIPNKKILINEKISTSPHIGASTKEAQQRIGIEIAQNIINFFR